MNLKIAAGRLVPLMRLATVLLMAGGCATSIVDQPSTFQNPPTLTAIYAVDSAGGFLPDVLVYSSTEPAKVSKAPSSYSSFRVEFDEPMASSIANANDLSAGAGSTILSYCSVPTGGAKVRLLDGTRVVPTSVCYDSSSPLGSNPHVTVVVGAGATNAAAPSPFTCRFFGAAPVDDVATGVLAASHDYTLDFAAASITGANGKALTVPTGTGWTGNQFKLSTSGFEVMAVGFQDVNTGFFTWLDKPTPGFLKDLAAVGASSYRQPADDTTFLIVTTMAVDDPTLLTITRGDGTPFVGASSDVPNDSRVIEVAPAVFWESDGQYKVTLQATLTGGGGISLPAAQQNKAYTLSSASASLRVVTSTPSAGATAQSISVAPTLNLQAPVDSASATAAGNVTLTGPSGAVAATVTVSGGSNQQQIKIAPAAKLTPAASYTITTQNLKVAATSGTLGTVPHAGENFAAFSSQFTTATFRTSGIFNGTASATNIDRASGRPVDLPANGNLTVAFTNAPDATTVNATNVTLSELTGPTSTAVPATISPVGGNAARFTVQITDPAYKLKFNQNYVVRAATAIKDSAPPAGSGQNLKAEGCTTGDCSDARSFTTAAFTISKITIVDAPTGKFDTVFSHKATLASINAAIASATAFQLFKQVGTGQTAVPITCTPLVADDTTVHCAANSALDPNTQYTASVVFLSSAPAVVTATINGKPTDQAGTGRFFGNIRKTFLSCQ